MHKGSICVQLYLLRYLFEMFRDALSTPALSSVMADVTARCHSHFQCVIKGIALNCDPLVYKTIM